MLTHALFKSSPSGTWTKANSQGAFIQADHLAVGVPKGGMTMNKC